MLKDFTHKKEQGTKFGQSEGDELISLLLQSNNQSMLEDNMRNKKNNGMTIEDLIEECKLFYFAGQEMTSSLLAWTIVVLAMHPIWQEKVRDEVHKVCDLWGDEVEEFSLERFAEGVSKTSKNQLTFFPFGWGTRTWNCQNFALIVAKMALVTIQQHFAFELAPLYTHAPYTVMTLQPQHGAQNILRQL
ncbi:hypothetical protein GIB67_040370 [Kingdonia uniflora]|uniref:11-oxo-beta-amyrin 30-oxidase n=1 Tax=Kingdonia uniflora TaxID=39325 RepID=A0A7J7L9E4_9MAGN|nr:hypothetical protein GIB67_040370 [Kingdonia uniflora]